MLFRVGHERNKGTNYEGEEQLKRSLRRTILSWRGENLLVKRQFFAFTFLRCALSKNWTRAVYSP